MSISTIVIPILFVLEIIIIICLVKNYFKMCGKYADMLSQYKLLEDIYYNLLKLMSDNMTEQELKTYISNTLKITMNSVGVNISELEANDISYEEVINNIYNECSNENWNDNNENNKTNEIKNKKD